MYPYRRSRKTLVFMFSLASVCSIILSTWKSNINSAQAYFPSEEVQSQYSSNLPSSELLGAVNEASVQASTVEVRLSAAADDAEQRSSDGFMYLDSSDLELVYDPGVTKGTQSVGLRFTGVNIPEGARIVRAYVEFQVDEASSEATSLQIHAQDTDNADAFTFSAFDISSRTKTNAGVNWNDIPAWDTPGANVQSPDLSGVIQEIVDRNGWAAGNSLALIIDGAGRRVAAAYEANPANAPLLHVEYEPAGGPSTPTPPAPTLPPATPSTTPPPTGEPNVVDSRISAKSDDAEQRLSDGRMYLTSSDLELVNDPGAAKGDQAAGLRFTNVTIPQGATIVQAYVEFQVKEASSEATSLTLRGQAADNAGTFNRSAYDVTNRAQTNASASWNDIPAWNTVGAKVQSPDLSAVIQEIVNRGGWAAGNSLVILITGSGKRVASAFDAGSAGAPLLHVQYSGGAATPQPPTATPTPISTTPPPPPTSTATATPQPPTPTSTPVSTTQPLVSDTRVRLPADDAEERASDGFMYLDSTDLELVEDPGVTGGTQHVGMRFSGVSVPQGATIIQAYVEFQVDETSSEATSLVVRGQDADNAGSFSTAAYNISNRTTTNASVNWNNIPAWNTVGARVQSPDLSSIIQEIVDRSGWTAGNSMVLIIDGLGRRVAAAYEANPAIAALLHIVYLPVITTATPTPPAPPDPEPTPVGQTGNWTLIFRDEFDGGSLDTSKWHTCFWWADVTCTIETNNEMELYNPEDVLVQNGLLRLRAQKRDMVAWNGDLYHYTSGMVMTGGRSGRIPPGLIYTYGYAEARVKIPAGQGLWPAFWMLPADYNSRPEIDIMEILGHEPNVYHMNYHYIGGDIGSTWNGPDFSAGWHVLGLDWRPDAIIWYVDGVERWRYTNTARISNEDSYLLLNLAVGGNWPGPPDDTTPFPSYFEIEYVRVWQR